VESGQITQEDAANFESFININNSLSFNMYIYGKEGKLPHLENDPEFQSSKKVMEKLGLSPIEIDKTTAMPYEQ